MFHVSVFCEATQQTAYFVFDRVSIAYEGAPGKSVLRASLQAPEGFSAHTPEEARQALIASRHGQSDEHIDACACFNCAHYGEASCPEVDDYNANSVS